jgi:hypothetical protein
VTRDEARLAGMSTYDEGSVCRRGHTPVLRRTVSGGCVACNRETTARWCAAHPERHRDAVRKWCARRRAANPEQAREHAREYAQRWRDKNRERLREYQREYQRRRRQGQTAPEA